MSAAPISAQRPQAISHVQPDAATGAGTIWTTGYDSTGKVYAYADIEPLFGKSFRAVVRVQGSVSGLLIMKGTESAGLIRFTADFDNGSCELVVSKTTQHADMRLVVGRGSQAHVYSFALPND